MPTDVGSTTFEYKPFKWVNKTAGLLGFFDPKRIKNDLEETAELYFGEDPDRKAAVIAKRGQQRATLDRRQNVLAEYQRLLPNANSTQKNLFNALYSQHYVNLQALQILDNQYEAYNFRLSEIRFPLLPKARVRMEENALRKESFLSNIKFHFNRANSNPWSKSMLIGMGISLGIAILVLGTVVLIPTMFTFLLPLPIALITLGIILITTSLILARTDQQIASELHPITNQHLEALLVEESATQDLLLQTWREMQAINFEPQVLSHHASPVSPEQRNSIEYSSRAMTSEIGIQCGPSMIFP